MRRVVVTGIGMCSPLGFGYDHCWKSLIESKSGIRKLTGFETSDLKSKVGGQLVLEGDESLFPNRDTTSYCQNCPAGRYGSGTGSIDPLCAGPCTAGFYCPSNV